MQKNFYILDCSTEVEGDSNVVYIWAIDEDNNRVALIDRNFIPYFYVVLNSEQDYERIEAKVRHIIGAEKKIVKIERKVMKYYGKEVPVLKIYISSNLFWKKLKDELSRVDGVKDVLEADIRPSLRYMINNELYPFTWYTMEVEEVNNKYKLRVDKVYEIKKILGSLESKETLLPDLRIMAFSIVVYNKYGYPDPRRDRILAIVAHTKDGVKLFVQNDNESDDARIIQQFVDFINSYDPDIIFGFNSNAFDWPYLLQRAENKGIRVYISRKPDTGANQGIYGHYGIAGRLNIDLAGFIESFADIKIKTLDNIAEYLGLMQKNEIVKVDWYDIPKMWEKEKDKFIKYAEFIGKAIYKLGLTLLDFIEQLSKITGLPADILSNASVGNRVEWLIIRNAYKMNELVPNRNEKEVESYRGGLVIEPKPGIHNDVYVLDFSSMYPSLMIKYNIGPDTLVQEECNDCYEAPEVGYKFRKEPPGIYKTLIARLVEERRKIKEELEKVNDETLKRLLNERQKAIKVMTNAFYGYMGWQTARWYSKEGAEAVTAWGRQTILTAANMAKEMGFSVIYGDTDSIFVHGDGNKVNELINKINGTLGLEIKIDKHFVRVLFTEAKKKYAGIDDKGEIDITGFEAIRSDWCDYAKEVQRGVIETILKTGDVNASIKYVKDRILKLRRREFRIEDLVIWKSIDRDISEYDRSDPHIVAALKAIKAGYPVFKGGKIGYVIVKGVGKISDRAEPYFMVKDLSIIDVEYYIDKQIVPAAMRVLDIFGVKENTLKENVVDITSFFSLKKK
ncbi:MAG: DNA polymerase II [Sulfolobaceae archaeon]|nr:DNA polymerase II [Sulfolobaceae archaeon]